MDLMRAMLISSDNLAAETLANTYPGGFKKYIQDVNEYAQGMGFVNTKLVDATGLLPGNVSTAKELTTFLWKIKDNVVIRWLVKQDLQMLRADA
jgi:D-alanyl-D-alanine endopeptidase (penicillin-binding protein 7)